ncbi:hypothetical protein L210DRAFT_2630647 [Boletus edulis BED1]|uniref:DUF6533 domain-containing protein n=1 Tax=Boletus edulis BED1 TaxID=1328754 RepID=A0AAD4GJZ2_BOLED|nr:hypothetical protein L210DRAFT_2630647 [Boletus edulis BED1]
MSVPSDVLGHLVTRKLVAFAGYTFLVYDYLLTLSLEVTYMWNTPWTVVKTLFLMNRYWNLIGQTFIMLEETGYLVHNSTQFCTAFELFLPFFVICSGESIRLLVAMRACAILGCKRSVAMTWYILYILYAIAVLGVVLYFFTHAGPLHFEYLDETGICITPAPLKLWTILFITLVLDSFLLVLVFYSLYRMTKVSRAVYCSRLIRLLARDAFLFYIATLFNSLFCILSWTLFRQDPRNMLSQLLSTPFIAVTGQHLVLNLRRLRTQPDSTRDLSREVARQMAAMSMSTDMEQSDLGLELGQLGNGRPVG